MWVEQKNFHCLLGIPARKRDQLKPQRDSEHTSQRLQGFYIWDLHISITFSPLWSSFVAVMYLLDAFIQRRQPHGRMNTNKTVREEEFAHCM